MSSFIVLGIRLTPDSFQRVKVYEVNLDDKIEKLKREASTKTNLPIKFVELIYCGNILEDGATLKSYGVKSGAMVHVVKKKIREIIFPMSRSTERDIQQLVRAFRTFTRHPGYRGALHRLSRPEVLENIITATPGLSEDPIALSILYDPELLFHMEDEDTVRRVSELHPPLAEAANQIAAAIHEEAAAGHSSHQGVTSGYSYSLDALSDEDEIIEASQTNGEGSLRQRTYTTITAAQLANALASATGLLPNSSQPSSSTTGPSTIITPEMVSQAMQQVIASSTSEALGFSTNLSSTSDLEELGRRLSRQVLQMRELGLTDNALNLQALRITGGDLQAAIDLIFSGTLPPNSD